MALRNRREELLAAWRALGGDSVQIGWRTIPIEQTVACRVLAGRYFPGNEEALLVELDSSHIHANVALPQGHGFLVSITNLNGGSAGRSWITLRRQNAGSLELFVMMADDVLSAIEGLGATSGDKLYNAFISRVWAWQEFMKRGEDGVLGAEAEIGLFGELEILGEVIGAGTHCSKAVEAWEGPMEKLHDFVFENGVLEVKTTTSLNGFPARIGSLEQLDCSLVQTMYLAGVKLELNARGSSLPDKVRELRALMQNHPFVLSDFNWRLIYGGYLDEFAARYNRHFSRVSIRVIQVLGDFPKLTRENVTGEISKVRYELNLDMVHVVDTELPQALAKLGVIS
jgi:hypothetical protein